MAKKNKRKEHYPVLSKKEITRGIRYFSGLENGKGRDINFVGPGWADEVINGLVRAQPRI